MNNLLIRGGHVIDPGQSINGPADIAIQGGQIEEVCASLADRPGWQTIDASGLLVTPGLIDMHTHVYWGGTALGVHLRDLDPGCGATTVVDAGSAGAGNLAGFQEHIISSSPVRVLAFLNISFGGIFGFGESVRVGEAGLTRLLDATLCADTARKHPRLIRGVKVRLGQHGSDGRLDVPLAAALQAAEACNLPVMAHVDLPPPVTRDVVDQLRKGDILTHLYRPLKPDSIESIEDTLRSVTIARKKGVILDVAHGLGSFSFKVAQTMLAAGLTPDVISSDLHLFNARSPVRSLTHTLSKFLAMDLSLEEVIRAATIAPAEALGLSTLGTLAPGSSADVALLEVQEGRYQWVDAVGHSIEGRVRLHCCGVVRNGEYEERPIRCR